MRRIALAAALAGSAACLLPVGSSAGPRVAICGLDRQYLQTSVSGDLSEIAGGRIAAARGVAPEVHELATRLVRDHSKALNAAGSLSRRLGLKVPGYPDQVMHWQLHVISTQSGSAFDRSYTWLEVADHTVDVQNAEREAAQGCHPAVRALARQDLPVLKAHLALATRAQSAVKAA